MFKNSILFHDVTSFTSITKLPTDIIKYIDTVRFIHKGLFNYINSILLFIEKDSLKIKLSETVFDTFFCPEDKFSIVITTLNNIVYKLDCVIKKFEFTDIFFDTFEITGNIKSIAYRNDLRIHQRHMVSFLGEIKSHHKRITESVKVNDVSLRGFRITSNKDIDLHEKFIFSKALRNEHRCFSEVIVVRKTTFGNLFMYGLEIIDSIS
jgi:hypothetical protein